MGCCASVKKQNVLLPEIRHSKPSIFIEENFKLMDFTNRTKDLKKISEILNYFSEFKLVDIRCVKRLNEGDEVHSTIIAMSNLVKTGQDIQELCLVVKYSPYGFALFVGEAQEILINCGVKENSMEKIHLPGTENSNKVNISQIIEWSFEHKDEKFMEIEKNKEMNMGHRIYNFILGIINIKNKI